jgi:hypothetical protein
MRGPSPDVSGAPWAWPLWGAPLDLLLMHATTIGCIHHLDGSPPFRVGNTMGRPTITRPIEAGGSVGIGAATPDPEP